MTQKMNRRTFLGASALALCLPSRLLFAKPSEDVVLRFAALSDVHYDKTHTDASAERVRFNAALKFMNEYSASQPYDKFDALVVAGDFSNHGVIEEIGPFKKTMDDNLKDSTRRILCMGNHEHYGGNRELWEKTFETPANRRQEVNGYQFITVAPEKGTCNENDYVYAREWLENEIKAAIDADPTKPVFLIQHYHVYGTVFASYDLPGDFHAGVKDFADILEKYPQIFHISGHSHYPSADPRTIWQGKFTAIGTGSMSYFGLGYESRLKRKLPENVNFRKSGTFLIFEVYRDDTIRIRLYDTISSSFMDREYLIVDPLNVEKYVYTDRRYDFAKNPVWSKDSKTKTIELAPNGIDVGFTRASDNDCLVSYRVVAEEKFFDEWKEKNESYVLSDFFMKEKPEMLEHVVDGLDPGAEYRLKIYGIGASRKETREPLIHEFATPKRVDPERNAKKPVADFLDVSFDAEKKEIVVKPELPDPAIFQRRYKAPKIEVDASGNAFALFNGVDESYQVPFSKLRGRLDEISLGAKFQFDPSKIQGAPSFAIFGSTENGGLSLDYHVKDKTLRALLWIGDKYHVLTTPFESKDIATAYLSWNKKEFAFYVNGEKRGSEKTSGAFRLTQDSSARAFCLGGDVCPNYDTRFFYPGKLYYARVYSWGLSQEQIQNLSKE